MNKKIEGNFEKQKQYQKDLQDIQDKCKKATTDIRQRLLDGCAIKLKNEDVMYIYNKIYRLTEDAGTAQALKNYSKNQNNRGEKVEEQLIQYFKDILNEFIADIYMRLNEFQGEKESVLFIVSRTYHDYRSYSYWLYKMFLYLDKFAMPHVGTSLCSTSLKLFKEGYFDKCNKLILNTILQFIQETRKNGILLNKQIKHLINLFSVMGSREVEFTKALGEYDYICKKQEDAQKYYKDNFQYYLLLETSKFYKDEIEDKQKFTAPEFVSWGNSIFKLELDMCIECYPKSQQAIENKLKIILVKDQATRLVDSPTGVGYMLQYDRTDELKQLFQFIFRTKECITHIAKAYQTYFEQQGQLINNSIEQEQQQVKDGRQIHEAELYFTRMLEVMEKAQSILKNQLQDEPEIQKSYSGAFMLVINKNEKSPMWLAIYTDIIIRSEKGVNEMETDKRLSKIVSLFQLLYQRDVFFRHYQKFLSNRLLNQQLQNIQLEKQLLQKFKGETGTNVLTQLSSMINDIEQSNRFASDQQISKDTKFDLNVFLLSQGCWPITTILDNVIKPIQIQNVLENYEKIYLGKHNGRILTWCFNMGQGELIYKLQADKYYLNVNTMQMIAFLLFNQATQFSIKNILEMTKIDKIDLENSLIPFVCLKIIQREKQEIEDFSDENEILKLNLGFNNRAKKMKLLPNPKMQPKRISKVKEQNQEELQQMEQINKQREFVVDSQLVRLMKSRKTIKHHELLENCQQMISIFKPDILFIKKRIENLIEREYIRRDEKDWNIYHYLN
ncbi:unnamed protein product (macronuclear) [Paramecium tetraurelia]|uniref:Cullin family profile domain-containing protein n=1 Tax=Paramecium tetraurelia TaxID=5888 RepID=A0CBV9_PARTE|nr:uncharacterized protein GSPATT00037059001 [Paramecium tetraurelia]CAK68276.1 unnamed protein product [Paramecium tetraurelia]|eukprot:XP_001435673.1 hypothetical protein (macronuclear) [Paramecium tetraurelia strain d4-2]